MSEENTKITTNEPDITSEPTTTDPEVTTDPTPTPEPTPPAYNEDDILESIKYSLGVMPGYTPFDPQIIMCINTALGIVNQLGVGVSGYRISDTNHGSWNAFMAPEITDDNFISEIQTYVSKKTQILFDPPTSSILMNAVNEIIKELEWRIVCHKETP